MPPRPRPRPNAVVLVVESDASTSAAAQMATREEEDDEDDLFIRSKGRSLREVHKRAARAVATAQTLSPTGSEDEDVDDEEDTPKQGFRKNHKKNVFNTGKTKVLPKWAKKGGIKSFLVGSDSESENKYDGHTPSKKRHGGGSGTGTPLGQHGKRARTRSRSRSLTPPPDLTDLERMRAQLAIQHALNSQPDNIPVRSYVVEVEDEGDEFDVGETMLDPSLQHIAQAVRDRASRHKGNDGLGGMHQSQQDLSRHHSSVGAAVVTIRVKWLPHPEDEAIFDRPQQSWLFTIKRHDSLKELFLQTSNKARVLAEDLVLMRDGKQVFTSVSAEGLGFWDQGDLEACDRTTFDALRLRHLRSPTPAQQSGNDSETDRDVSAAPDALLEPDDADKFKVVLRAHGMKEITLSVRPTTTCGKIVRAFLAVAAKQGGKAPASPLKAAQVRLRIDGEKQHPDAPISDCDLEDGDLIEVVGL